MRAVGHRQIRESPENQRAKVREDAAQYPLGRVLVEEVLADSTALAYEPLRAEALLRAGCLAMESGDHPTAERHYNDALLAAVGSGHATVAAVASSKQLFLRASPLSQLQQARAQVPLATALNHRVEHDVDLYAEFLINLGVVHAVASELPVARRHWEEAVALRERHHRGETLAGLNTLSNLGWLARAERRDEDMAAIYERIVAISEPLLGPHHADHLRYEWMLANSQWRLGRPRQALARLGQIVQCFDHLGNAHTRGTILHDLGMIEIDEGDLVAARTHLEQALAAVPESSEVHDTVLVERSTAPPRSLLLVGNLTALAELALARGRFDAAAGSAAQALAVYDDVSEPDHTPAARARFAMARALAADAPVAPANARALAEEALAAFRAKSRAADVRRVTAWLAAHPKSVSGQ